ncbi:MULTISPECIES: hypothetical protein [unclassified Nocardiopsis]|uniref:hypothetical protein n=1 Tax=unclassified Nocardiopsis TaxID=2649073 RepID=UPI00135C76FE|nr:MULTISPECIES: hypothetical protein [unclassified Nocardiopsis]
MHHVQHDLVLRPGLRAGWTRLAFGMAGAVLVTADIWFFAGLGAALAAAAGWAVLLSLAIAHLYRARIILTAYEIVLRGAFFQRRRPRARAVWTIRATVVQPQGHSCDTLFVLDAHGGVLVRLHGTNYGTEDLDRFVDALGLPCSGPDGPVTPKQLHAFRPGLTSWVERHPYLLGFAITGVLVLITLVGVLVGTVMAA